MLSFPFISFYLFCVLLDVIVSLLCVRARLSKSFHC